VEDGVEVICRDRKRGGEFMRRGDYCMSNIPLPVLQKIPAKFLCEFKQAVDCALRAGVQSGWQANDGFGNGQISDLWRVSFTDESFGRFGILTWLLSEIRRPGRGYMAGMMRQSSAR